MFQMWKFKNLSQQGGPVHLAKKILDFYLQINSNPLMDSKLWDLLFRKDTLALWEHIGLEGQGCHAYVRAETYSKKPKGCWLRLGWWKWGYKRVNWLEKYQENNYSKTWWLDVRFEEWGVKNDS